jgi:hypothetical protein
MAALFASYGVLISLSILGLVCVAVLALLIAVASKSRPKSDDPAEAAADISIAAVKASFLRAVQQIESSLVSRSERHEIPWVMVLDEPDNSFDMPLEEAGCSSLISEEAAKSLNTPGLQWHVLEQGVVVEVNTISKGSESEGRAGDLSLTGCKNTGSDRAIGFDRCLDSLLPVGIRSIR